jgi:Domain of unknown function (DUF1844)
MSEEQSNFKVTDRRLFNADGTPRDLPADERPEPPRASTETSVNEPPPESQAESKTVSNAQAAAEAATAAQPARETAEDSELPDAKDPASFVNFMMSIASNAAASLGMMEHPVTHERDLDLELGKHWIDVLGMLQQKTRGNLSPQEQQILEGLLADLRMQYVSLANSPSAKAPRTYTGRDIIGGG